MLHPFKKFADGKIGAAITVKVTAHAKQTGVAGVLDDGTIKIHVAAPAEAGRANQTLIEFLASTLGIPGSAVDIVAGLSAERKLISLVGVSPQEVEQKLRALAGGKEAKAGKDHAGKPAKAKPAKAKAKKKK